MATVLPVRTSFPSINIGKEVKEKAIEVTLWEAANKLRGSVEPAEYKHVVLGLIFLKFASDKFEEHRAKLIADGKEKYIEMPEFYNMNNVFFLEETSRWSYLIKKPNKTTLPLLIDTALHTIEKNNKALKGALPDNYFSRLGLDVPNWLLCSIPLTILIPPKTQSKML
jgi:type I restriction enzyme M protein